MSKSQTINFEVSGSFIIDGDCFETALDVVIREIESENLLTGIADTIPCDKEYDYTDWQVSYTDDSGRVRIRNLSMERLINERMATN